MFSAEVFTEHAKASICAFYDDTDISTKLEIRYPLGV